MQEWAPKLWKTRIPEGKEQKDPPPSQGSNGAGGEPRGRHISRDGDGCVGSDGCDEEDDDDDETQEASATAALTGAGGSDVSKKKKRKRPKKKKKSTPTQQAIQARPAHELRCSNANDAPGQGWRAAPRGTAQLGGC
ncbi:hypothetical protein NQ176_g9618 [Zarea fungicola]|uniref:Uncharacterized protein n=1 Tax=Zarea fungicola TaxID=93591 RepID=A0ACC1ML04_9HYPO|nr:hypothetical protein NQ176_g9618 [Lecanicillium fungicola]